MSWADLIQLASAVAIEHAGGPKIDMKYGRVDASGPDECPTVSTAVTATTAAAATAVRGAVVVLLSRRWLATLFTARDVL